MNETPVFLGKKECVPEVYVWFSSVFTSGSLVVVGEKTPNKHMRGQVRGQSVMCRIIEPHRHGLELGDFVIKSDTFLA
jgi:hypothetical protein